MQTNPAVYSIIQYTVYFRDQPCVGWGYLVFLGLSAVYLHIV